MSERRYTGRYFSKTKKPDIEECIKCQSECFMSGEYFASHEHTHPRFVADAGIQCTTSQSPEWVGYVFNS